MTVPDESAARNCNVLVVGGGPVGTTIVVPRVVRPWNIRDAAAVRVKYVVAR